MKIIFEHYDRKYSIEGSDEVTIEGMEEILRKMLYSMGYHLDSIDELFGGKNY